jgi:hypothetical protein
MLEVATIPWSRPARLSEVGALLPTTGGEATKGRYCQLQKSPAPIFTHFKTLAMASVNFTTTVGRKKKAPVKKKVRHCFSLLPGGFRMNFSPIFLYKTLTISFYYSKKN